MFGGFPRGFLLLVRMVLRGKGRGMGTILRLGETLAFSREGIISSFLGGGVDVAEDVSDTEEGGYACGSKRCAACRSGDVPRASHSHRS